MSKENKTYLDKLCEKVLPERSKELKLGKYNVTEAGVTYEEKVRGTSSEMRTVVVSRSPMIVRGIYVDPNGVERIQISFICDGKVKSCICSREDIASTAKIVKALANYGIDVTSVNAKALLSYLSDFIADNRGGFIVPQYTYNQLGWYKDGMQKCFIPYDNSIICDGAGIDKQILEAACKRAGTLEDWVSYVKPLCECIEMRLCIAASFASVLIARVGVLPFIFHIWGKGSTGKTVALTVAASVWGDPKNGGLIRSMNSTRNALMSAAAFLQNLPLICDELQTIKEKGANYDRFIMEITEGMNRSRLNKDAESKATLSWALAVLSSGEEPITQSNSGGGAVNRVIEVAVLPENMLIKNGNETINFVRENYGTAGRAFINEIEKIDDKDFQNFYKEAFDGIVGSCRTNDKQASAMAVLMVADTIARNKFWPGLPELKVEDISKFLHTLEESSVAERAFEFLCSWIVQNQMRFNPDTGYIKAEVYGMFDENYCYVIKKAAADALKDECYSFDAVKSEWAASGYIIRDKTSFTHKKRIGELNANCIRIPRNKLNME